MKAFLRILVLLQIVVLFMGCDSKEMSPLLYKDKAETISSNGDSDHLNYTIDKITLSQSYQSIEPNIEILKNGLDSKLLLSLGIVPSSGVSVEKIEKVGRDVNIFIENQKENGFTDLVVPQIIINFKDLSQRDLENLNFKIINKNYEPIKSNIDIGEAINKIKSSLKIATSTFPSSKIKEEDGKMFLDLDFTNVVDLANKKHPIVNLNVLIDLINGNIVKSDKNPVSSLIDEGSILEYVPNKYLLYVKEEAAENDISYDLWIYDIKKDTRERIFTSKKKISCLKFNEDENRAFFISSLGGYSELHILELKDLKVHKPSLDKKVNPTAAIWKDEDIVLVDKHNESAKIYSFDLKTNSLQLISSVDKDIKQLQYLDENFLFTIDNDKLQEIYITKDFKNNILIDRGKKPLFIDSKTIAYLKNDNNTGEYILWFYSLEDKTIEPYTDMYIKDYFIWKDNLAFIEKTHIASENPLYVYNFRDKKIDFITSVKTDKIFLNTEQNLLYLNSSIDMGENKTSVISFTSLEN